MTRRNDMTCIHEPFGDAFYFGPERMGTRYENDEKAREESGFADSTFQTILDRIDGEKEEVSPLSALIPTFFIEPPLVVVRYAVVSLFRSMFLGHASIPTDATVAGFVPTERQTNACPAAASCRRAQHGSHHATLANASNPFFPRYSRVSLWCQKSHQHQKLTFCTRASVSSSKTSLTTLSRRTSSPRALLLRWASPSVASAPTARAVARMARSRARLTPA